MRRYDLILMVCLLAGLAACSDDKNSEQPAPVPGITLDGTGSSLLFETGGGSQSVSFNATVGWTAETDQDWCSVLPASGGAGDASVTVTLEANDTPDERNATLVLTAGTATKRITLVQKQQDALTVTSNKVEMDAAGGNFEIEVQANVSFGYELDEDAAAWIAPVETKALTTTCLQFSVQPNDNEEKREGRIVLRAGELTETVTVYQAAGMPTLVLTQNEYTVGSAGGEIVIELQSNVEYEMILPGQADWISKAVTRAFSTYTHRIQVAPNEDYDLREAEIHFVNEQKEIDEVVHILQVQKNAILVAKNSYEVTAEAGQLDFSINTNVDFQVSVSADWLRQAPDTRGLVEVPLSFVYESNEEETPREAVITLSADGVEQTVTVVQEGIKNENRVSIVHSGQTFTAPLITGVSFTDAFISWGDGTREEYKAEATHAYGDGGIHTVVIESVGAEEITLPDLEGVSEIDLSAF